MARRSPARFLAPIALVGFAVALYVVVDHGVQQGKSTTSAGQRTPTPTGSAKSSRRRSRHHRKTYTVKPGDTPSGIAAKTGVPLATLQKLNPKLDPQSLAPGEKIRLRR